MFKFIPWTHWVGILLLVFPKSDGTLNVEMTLWKVNCVRPEDIQTTITFFPVSGTVDCANRCRSNTTCEPDSCFGVVVQTKPGGSTTCGKLVSSFEGISIRAERMCGVEGYSAVLYYKARTTLDSCPDRWVFLQESMSCYWIDQTLTSEITWLEAKTQCEDKHAHLPKMTSKTQNRFVSSMAHGKRTWVGASNFERPQDGYVWIDGCPLMSNKHWGPKQPDNSAGRENCAEIFWSSDGTWNDRNCFATMPWVCQLEL